MPRASDTKRFRNEQLVLRVSDTVDPKRWDERRYEALFDALCGPYEFQKTALRTTLRYLLGGRYANLKELSEENFHSSESLQDRYGTFAEMERHLLLPDRLYCTLDLATGTGKSYVLYGLAMVLLAEGAVDRVLVLCPSTTIEVGLIKKFRQLAGDADIRDSFPADAKLSTPRVIRADETITDGCICIENYHAVLAHVKSSVRDSLSGRGSTTLVLNDEVHHVASGRGQDQHRWKEFLEDPEFGFHRIVGDSGTCYVGDDFFADVISRYSLRQAIQDGFVKNIDYVAEANIGSEPSERYQIILDNHKRNCRTYRKVKPVTIFVTRDIRICEQIAEEWVDFLAERDGLDRDTAKEKVLVITSSPKHIINLTKLSTIDRKDSPVEWIFSVAMLSEGWDVKNVFQIVPHERRAFNSKLLIAQVLGRGLRVPPPYAGKRPSVTVFNHDAWSAGIKHLVDEILEIEKRLTSKCVDSNDAYNFNLHQIDYTRDPETRNYIQEDEYDLLKKGYVDIPSQFTAIDREVEYERATTGERFKRKTKVMMHMHTVAEVAAHIYERLKSIDRETQALRNSKLQTSYAKKYNLRWCTDMVRGSVRRVGEKNDRVSEENRQKILQALGPLQRDAAKAVRYQLRPERIHVISTKERPANSVSINSLRKGDAAIFFSPDSRETFQDEELAIFHEAIGSDSELPKRSILAVSNALCFKTPLNIVIANHEPERRFIRKLLESENAEKFDAWMKSTDRDFYPIEFSWKKGEHTKRASFNPDFFLKRGKRIFVIEIKDDSEVADPSNENMKKAEFAQEHFNRVNKEQSDVVYQINFLTPIDFEAFFQKLRADELQRYRSHLDVALIK